MMIHDFNTEAEKSELRKPEREPEDLDKVKAKNYTATANKYYELEQFDMKFRGIIFLSTASISAISIESRNNYLLGSEEGDIYSLRHSKGKTQVEFIYQSSIA